MAAQNKIAYANIRAEMGRRNLSISSMAALIGMCTDTLSRKLAREASFKLEEAYLLAKTCFPDVDVQELFWECLK